MSEPTSIPTYEVILPQPPEDKWQRERRAFYRLLPELFRTHLGKFVAVHEESVVDSGDDEIALASRVYARHGYVPIYVGLVSDRPPRVERIPTPLTFPRSRRALPDPTSSRRG